LTLAIDCWITLLTHRRVSNWILPTTNYMLFNFRALSSTWRWYGTSSHVLNRKRFKK
jgi:hypothetical protein